MKTRVFLNTLAHKSKFNYAFGEAVGSAVSAGANVAAGVAVASGAAVASAVAAGVTVGSAVASGVAVGFAVVSGVTVGAAVGAASFALITTGVVSITRSLPLYETAFDVSLSTSSTLKLVLNPSFV